MNGAAQAILWQVWRRHRWGLSADLAYLAIGPAIVELLPLNMGKQPVANLLGLAGIAVLTHLVGVFSYGFEADLAKKESGYPPRDFVLPVSNWTLTCWPAIGGAAALLISWLILAAGVWRPCGYETPLWWPGAAAAALLGMSQAIGWTPFSHHWLRFVVAIVTCGTITAVGAAAAGLFDADERLLLGGFAAVWTLFVAAAYVGVGRSRRGEPVSWRWLDRIGSRFATSRRAARGAFRSPLRAQLWFEMRRHGWMLPTFLATILVCFVPILLVPNGQALPAWKILAMIASLPPLLAGIVALGFGKSDAVQRGTVMPQFMATRPISCARFIAAKMLAAALSVLISCGLVLVVLLPWLLRSGTQQSLSILWQGVPTWKVVTMGTLAVVYWVAFTWRQLAGSIWVALTGRDCVGVVNSFAFSLFLMAAAAVGVWLSLYPESYQKLLVFVPWCMAVMLIAKIAAGSWCAQQLMLRGLLSPHTVGLLLAVWCAAVAISCGVIFWLTPGDLWARVSLVQVVCGVVLTAPFARLAGTPLALSFNRHR